MTEWTQEECDLWYRIQKLEIPSPYEAAAFRERLCQENDWTNEFFNRVLKEYKRLLFLTMVSGHQTAPSTVVDKLCDLHLLHNWSWEHELCGKTLLNKKIYHFPFHGEPGPIDRIKRFLLYSMTRTAYIRLFNEETPEDIWET